MVLLAMSCVGWCVWLVGGWCVGVGVGMGVGVVEEHMRWGPVVRAAARAVFCMGRIRDEEEEGLGDVGSSSNRLKWSRDSWELHS